MRAVVAALLALTACAKEPEPPMFRDVGSFCGVPPSICDHRLVDEKGHVVVPRECVEAGVDAGRD
jgi:hypothetical protein